MSIAGTFYIVLFIAMVGFSGVFQGHITQDVTPMLFLFYSSLVPFLFFSLLTIAPHPKAFWAKCKGNAVAIAALNVSSLAVWGAYMYALKYLEPAICVIIANAVGPVLMILFSYYLRPQSRTHILEKMASVGIFLGLCFTVAASLAGKSALTILNTNHILLGIVLAAITGVGQVFFGIYSKKLSESGFTPGEIMALRFQLGVIVAFVLIDHPTLISIFQNCWLFLSVMSIAVLGIMLPTFFLQKGIRLTEPIYLSVLMLIEPLFMFVGQWFDPRLTISWFSYFGVGSIFLFSCLALVGRYKEEHPQQTRC